MSFNDKYLKTCLSFGQRKYGHLNLDKCNALPCTPLAVLSMYITYFNIKFTLPIPLKPKKGLFHKTEIFILEFLKLYYVSQQSLDRE